VRLWCDAVKSDGPDELAEFEARTFKQWDRASLSAERIRDRSEAARASG
jgi:hypothetical protein